MLTETLNTTGLTDNQTVESVSTFNADSRLVARSTYPEVLKDAIGLSDILTFCWSPREYSVDSSTFVDRIPQLRDAQGNLWFKEDYLSPQACADPYFATGNGSEQTISLVYRAMQVRRPVSEPLALVQSVRSSYLTEGNILWSRAPSSSLGAYTGLLSRSDYDPTYRSPAWSILARFLYKSHTADPDEDVIMIRKLTTVDQALRNGQPADIGDAVLLNLRKLPVDLLGKIRKFGLNIIDVSNTYEDTVQPLSSPPADPDLFETVSLSLSNQDLEIGLFMCVIPFNIYNGSADYRIEIPEYHIVDHAISLFQEKDEVAFDSSNFGRLMRYARVLRTLFHQTAAMRYGINLFMEDSNNPFDSDQIAHLIEMNVVAIPKNVNAPYSSSFFWIPFEIIPALGGRDITDAEDYVVGRVGNMVSKKVVFPKSFRRPITSSTAIRWLDVAGDEVYTLDDSQGSQYFMVSWPKSFAYGGANNVATVDRVSVDEELGGSFLEPFRSSGAPAFISL